MSEEMVNEYKAQVVRIALRDICDELAKAARSYTQGEISVGEFLELVRETDDMAARIAGME